MELRVWSGCSWRRGSFGVMISSLRRLSSLLANFQGRLKALPSTSAVVLISWSQLGPSVKQHPGPAVQFQQALWQTVPFWEMTHCCCLLRPDGVDKVPSSLPWNRWCNWIGFQYDARYPHFTRAGFYASGNRTVPDGDLIPEDLRLIGNQHGHSSHFVSADPSSSATSFGDTQKSSPAFCFWQLIAKASAMCIEKDKDIYSKKGLGI